MSTLASVFGYGLLSARPAASVAGRFYYATDTTLMYRDNGSSWDSLSVGTGSMATDTLWAAAGDLAIGTGSHTAHKLAAGTSGTFLKSAGAADPTWSNPPGTQLDTGSITSNVSVTQTGNSTTGNTDLVVAAAGYTANGTDTVKVTFSAPWWNPDTVAAGRFLALYLFDDSGASLGRVALCVSQVAGASDHQVCKAESATLTPAAGTRTYSIRAGVTAGTGTVAAGAGGSGNDSPAIIRVIKVA